MNDIKESSAFIENYLKLRTLPLAIKFFETPEEMVQSVPKIRSWPDRLSFCQYVTMARTTGWTMGVTVKNLSMADCMWTLGLAPLPEEGILDGEFLVGVWNRTQEDAAKWKQSQTRIPYGKHNAVAVSPIASGKLEDPDITLIYGTPAQMNLILNAAQWEDYERFNFYFCGEGSCSDSLAECYLKQKLHLTVPCFGQRRFGHVQDDEMEVAIPPSQLAAIAEGLKGLKRAGTASYPIATYGPMCSPMPVITMVYPQLREYIDAIDRGEFPKRLQKKNQ